MPRVAEFEDNESSSDGSGKEEENEGEGLGDVDLKNLSFAELQELKQRLGLRGYREAMSKDFGSKKRVQDFKRANKNRPREESSKRRARVQPVKPVREIRDPRFDDRAGEYKPEAFRYHYQFLDDVKSAEIEKLKKKLKKTKDPEKQKELKDSMQRLKNQLVEQERKDKAKEEQEADKKTNIERLKEGKTPFFKNKTAKRSEELEDKFWELKQQGKLQNYMKKKRRRVAADDRKNLEFE